MPYVKLLITLLASLVMAACATSEQQLYGQAPLIDRISDEELARIMPKPVAALSLEDLVELSKEGATADQVIDKIRETNSFYDLTPSQSVELDRQGIDSKVLDYIHASHERVLRNNVADELNRREKSRRAELENLKKQQLQPQQLLYDPFCRYGASPYGYGAFGSRIGSRFGLSTGFGRPLGCW
jgi:hypothetical protein